MRNGWSLFRNQAENISDYFPKLTCSIEENGRPYLSGLIDLKDEKNSVIDSYNIAIIPTDKYPAEFPYVYEIGGRIPKNIDWHVYGDGHCCVKAQPEEILICSRGLTLYGFITEQVIPYFFNQKHRELYGYFLQERSHGQQGNLESFKEIFNTTDREVIKRCLEFIAKREKPNRVSICFCGSGRKYRKCHRETYKLLQHLTDQDIALYSLLLNS